MEVVLFHIDSQSAGVRNESVQRRSSFNNKGAKGIKEIIVKELKKREMNETFSALFFMVLCINTLILIPSWTWKINFGTAEG